MGILIGLLLFVEAVCSFLLIGIILIQKSKGGGMGTAFGGEMGSALFGSRAGNVLTRGTIILGSVFLANTLLLAILISGRQDRSLMEQFGNEPAAPVAPVAPVQGPTPPMAPVPAEAPQPVPAMSPVPQADAPGPVVAPDMPAAPVEAAPDTPAGS